MIHSGTPDDWNRVRGCGEPTEPAAEAGEEHKRSVGTVVGASVPFLRNTGAEKAASPS
jgi:hypothetical protein